MKKKLNFLFIFLLPGFSLSAQQKQYTVQVEVNNAEALSKHPVLVARVEHTFLIKEITEQKFSFDLDSIVAYPRAVVVDYYPDCNQSDLKDLKLHGFLNHGGIGVDIFIDEHINALAIGKDTIAVVNPSLLHREYETIENEIMARVHIFNKAIGDRLYTEFKQAKTQEEKDSLHQLSDNIFKANVGRPNLDSVLMPAIQNNLENAISLFAMNKYLWQARVFQMEIPGSAFQSMLTSMPESQKGYEIWKELYNIVKDIHPDKDLIGKAAPEFADLKDSSGRSIYLKDLKGKIVFIDFWASWCGPCIKQLPQLKQIYDSVKGKKVAFVSISIDDNVNSWKREIRSSKISWINVSDLKANNGKTSVDYNILTVPHNFLIDKNGIIVGKDIPLDSLEEMIKQYN